MNSSPLNNSFNSQEIQKMGQPSPAIASPSTGVPQPSGKDLAQSRVKGNANQQSDTTEFPTETAVEDAPPQILAVATANIPSSKEILSDEDIQEINEYINVMETYISEQNELPTDRENFNSGVDWLNEKISKFSSSSSQGNNEILRAMKDLKTKMEILYSANDDTKLNAVKNPDSQEFKKLKLENFKIFIPDPELKDSDKMVLAEEVNNKSNATYKDERSLFKMEENKIFENVFHGGKQVKEDFTKFFESQKEYFKLSQDIKAEEHKENPTPKLKKELKRTEKKLKQIDKQLARLNKTQTQEEHQNDPNFGKTLFGGKPQEFMTGKETMTMPQFLEEKRAAKLEKAKTKKAEAKAELEQGPGFFKKRKLNKKIKKQSKKIDKYETS